MLAVDEKETVRAECAINVNIVKVRHDTVITVTIKLSTAKRKNQNLLSISLWQEVKERVAGKATRLYSVLPLCP